MRRKLQVIILSIFMFVPLFNLAFVNEAQALRYSMNTDLSKVDVSFLGEERYDGVGYNIAGAGDVNGDGLDDLLISGVRDRGGSSLTGRVYLLFGRESGWSMDIDLSTADASFIGEDSTSLTGPNVAGAGDVNNDGYGDFLISLQYDDEGGDQAGQTYLILGKASGWAMDIPLENVDASFIGENEHDYSGDLIAGAGDVNGDGYDDILIGAIGNDDGADGGGKTYLILGKASGWAMDTNLSTAEASFIGDGYLAWSGSAVAGAGDVNKDGYDDFLIGAYGDSEVLKYAGQVYLILGRASGWKKDTNLSGSDASFQGESAGDRLGYSLDGAGDVNGDGYDDILIGAYNNSRSADSAGQTYLIFGKGSGWSRDVLVSQADASFMGEKTEDRSGISVALAGDVDNDGFDDILIGGIGNDEGGNAAGKTYLILGKGSGWSMYQSLSNVDASFIGEEEKDNSGRNVAGVGDVNGDDYDDILIGAHFNGEGEFEAGQVYLIYPQRNKVPVSISSVKIYHEPDYVNEIHYAAVNQTVYLELTGTDGDPTHADIAYVEVKSNVGDPSGFKLRLFESGPNTGKYRGDLIIKNETNGLLRWIKASNGEDVIVTSVQDTSKKASIFIGELTLKPDRDVMTTLEDDLYNVHYWAVNGSVDTWIFDTNASWLSFSNDDHNMTGTPGNDDVGTYWVHIRIEDRFGNNDQHDFTLIVLNVNDPPIIISTPKGKVDLGSDYVYNVDATDLDKGDVLRYSISKGPEGMVIDEDTGVLTWTPKAGEVGTHEVTVAVTDSIATVDQTFKLKVKDPSKDPTTTTVDDLCPFLILLIAIIVAVMVILILKEKWKRDRDK